MAERDMNAENRLMSVDFFRGVVMFLLIAEATRLYDVLAAPSLKGTVFGWVGTEFQHVPWHGLHLWDLGQPFFMFISGVAMAFSYGKRWERGVQWTVMLRQALVRSLWLFLFGWLIYAVNPPEGSFPGAFLYDVLPQLSLACLVAFLIMRRPLAVRISVSLGLLVLTELLYRFWWIPGFNQPFAPGHNFGSCLDLLLIGRLSPDHWVAFNAVPLAALTIWGTLVGERLRGQASPARKLRGFVLLGLIGASAGFALDSVTPIVRRIATSSFVIETGGLCLLALALAYGLVDVLGLRKPAMLFAVVGMNPLFIYVFTQTGGADWLWKIATPFGLGLFGWAGQRAGLAATSLIVLALLWGLCYWFFRRRIFIRL
jgi:predicted acyltransferase